MVSDVAELTRILRQTSGLQPRTNGGLRSRLRQMSDQIRAELAATGQSIFTDEHGNRYLIQRESETREATGTPGTF